MKWFELVYALLPTIEALYKAISDAVNAGKPASTIHAQILDHVNALPAKIRE